MPQPKSISPGKGREALWQKVQIFRLNMVRLNRTYWLNRTYYSLLKLQAKFSKLSPPVKFQRITQIPLNSPTQSANSAKFAHFVNLFYIMFQAPAPTENAQEFQRIVKFYAVRPHSPRIMRNSHHLLTLHLMFQMPDQWQTTP